jgi:hypothetical protein
MPGRAALAGEYDVTEPAITSVRICWRPASF